MIARLTLLVWLIGAGYMFMTSEGESERQAKKEHVVTWAEFSKDFLAKGEV